MSFYSVKNPTSDLSPGRVREESINRNMERVCIEVNKVYDACMQQETLTNVTICLSRIRPEPPIPVPPFTFVSCRSTSIHGHITSLTIQRLTDRPSFARVRATIDIPIDVVFTDANDNEFTGSGILTVNKDVILFVPSESIIPFEVDNLVSAICVSGTYTGNTCFNITLCVTIILKIIAEVNLLIPAFGFCRIPPCEEFAENVCDEFFALPLFPPQMEGTTC